MKKFISHTGDFFPYSTSEMCVRLTYIGKICTIFHTRHIQVVKHNHYLFFGLSFFHMM